MGRCSHLTLKNGQRCNSLLRGKIAGVLLLLLTRTGKDLLPGRQLGMGMNNIFKLQSSSAIKLFDLSDVFGGDPFHLHEGGVGGCKDALEAAEMREESLFLDGADAGDLVDH